MIRLIVALVLLATPAAAHEWYADKHNPRSTIPCCNNRDCFKLDIDQVTERADGGWDVASHGRIFHFAKEDGQPSQDGDFHACIWNVDKEDPKGMRPMCFFYPMNVRRDVSSKFAWGYKGPKPTVLSPYSKQEQAEIAAAFMALRWIAASQEGK